MTEIKKDVLPPPVKVKEAPKPPRNIYAEIAQVLKNSGADSKSQVSALERIREILENK